MNESYRKIESLYLHFPFCRHLCNYCDFSKHLTDSEYTLDRYHFYLDKSLLLHNQLLSKEDQYLAPLKTFYIGGGTPSLWGEAGPKKIDFKLAANCEATLEVNPGSWDQKSLDLWQDWGINRFSLGVQSTQDFFLKTLDRVHSSKDVFDTLKNFKENFSVDFMLGLPFSERENRDIISELKQIMEFNPKHFSVYILTVAKNYPQFKNLPSEDFIHDEYLKVSEFLTGHGFNHYEVSNFALPGFESQHNLAYWKSNSVAALGPSATGLLVKENSALRYKWRGVDATYQIEHLNQEQLLLEKLYMGLRSQVGYDLKQYQSLLSKWSYLGYIKSHNDGHIVLNSKGFLLLDSLMDDIFMADKAIKIKDL